MARIHLIRSSQGGFGVLMMLVFTLAVGAASAGLLFYSPGSTAVNQDRDSATLATARNALIAYAASRGGATGVGRPGELPCPDTNNDGVEEATCGAGVLGRLPWKTLGIAEPKDSAGEGLWYAVAGPFRTQPSNTGRINSNTRGNLVVKAADQVTPLATDVVAVVISPGASLGAQRRGGGGLISALLCGSTGLTLLPNLCPSNYLESSNSVAGGPFVATNGAGSWVYCTDTGAYYPTVLTCATPWQQVFYNDRLMYIRTGELMPAVEMRVGNELKSLLLAYRHNSACRCYPWADSWAYSGGIGDTGVPRGRFPTVAYPENWGSGSIPALPAWVAANDWQNSAYYAVGRQETNGGGALCFFCSPASTVTVDGAPVSALLFTPGTPPPGVDRASTANRDNIAYYLSDAANQDGAMCPGWDAENAQTAVRGTAPSVALTCDQYVRPTSKAYDRDRIYTVTTTPGAR